MNREILFRGKRIDNGEWVEGYYFKWPCISWKELSDVIVPVADLADGCAKQEIVDQATICQFTGLTDKNGKRIFEGDIVAMLWDNEKVLRVVHYKNGLFKAGSIPLCSFTGFDNPKHNCEVIGNIHDNPELMEGE